MMRWRSSFTLIDRIERGLAALSLAAHNHPLKTLTLIGVSTALVLTFAGKLPMNADLAGLLPSSFKSVQDLEVVKQRFGGIGYVVVVGQAANPDALRKWADDLAPQLEALDSIRYVEHQRPNSFFEDRILYFLDTEDLEQVEQRISKRFAWEQRANNPLYIDLEDDEPPSLDFSDLQDAYAARSDQTWMRSQIGEKYYIDPDKRIIAVLAKPASAAFDMAFARRVVNDVKRVAGSMDPALYDDVQVDFTGRYTRRIDQQDLLQGDLKVASLVALALMLIYLAVHFRRMLAVVLIIVPLVIGLLWAYGFAAFTFGSLNILTGFIGAILLGLGVDHGIHLLGRYETERAAGKSPDRAIRETFGNTGRAVTIAAATTAVGFAGLGLSEFRAFHEFGIVAAGGMVFVVISYVTCLPALLAVATRWGWKPHTQADVYATAGSFWLSTYARPVFLAGSVVLAIVALQTTKARFDFDFSALEANELTSYRLDGPTNELLGYSQSPVVVLTENLDEEQIIADAMRARQAKLGDKTTVDFIVASADLVALNQEEKVPILARLNEVVRKIKPGQIDPKYRPYLGDLRRMTLAKPFSRNDLPIEVQRQFRSLDGDHEYGFVLVFPRVSLSDGAAVWRFAREVRNVPLPGGHEISAAGESMILADIFDMVTREAPRVLIITLSLIFITLIVLLGNFRHAILCLAPGVGTLLVTLGLLPLIGIELNYLNIVMIPVLFGIAVDGGAHLVTRAATGAPITVVVGETGRAIAGAILTTGLGFAAMMLAHHPGLNSLGALAVVGLAVNAVITLLILPSYLAWRPLAPGTVSGSDQLPTTKIWSPTVSRSRHQH